MTISPSPERRREVVLEQVGGARSRARRDSPRATTEPSSASSTAGRSEAGSPWASVPPIVPRLRTCWSAIVAAALAASPRPLVATSWWRVIAPMRTVPSVRSMPAQPGHAPEVDEQRGRGQPQLHQRHERVAAREHLGVLAALAQRGQRGVERVRRDVVELGGDHAVTPPFSWIASHTRMGVSGMLMKSTPTGPQRVDHRVRDRRARGDRAGLADALHAERVRPATA